MKTASRSTHNLGSGYVQGVYVELEVHECGVCGVTFGMSVGFVNTRRNDHQSWYCPNGHSWSFTGESRAEQLKRERDEARRRAQANEDLLRQEEHSHRATRGHLTRTKRRVAAGVCPCCKRSFRDLARHMEGQHPDYVKSAKA